MPSILSKAFCGKEKEEKETDQIPLGTVSGGKAKEQLLDFLVD